MVESRMWVESALNLFVETYAPKYPEVTECLKKDCAALLAPHDFRPSYWPRLRSSNVIESACATIWYCTDRSKGCVTRDTPGSTGRDPRPRATGSLVARGASLNFIAVPAAHAPRNSGKPEKRSFIQLINPPRSKNSTCRGDML